MAAADVVAEKGDTPTRASASIGVGSRRLLGSATDLQDAQLRDLLTFDGHEELLRGCRLRTVVRGGSRILSSSGGDASTFALSEQTSRLQAFISHNWAVSRWRKYTCLAFHYNLWIGAVAAAVMLAVIIVAQYCGWLPTFPVAGLERGVAARVATIPVTMFALHFGRDVLPLLKGPLVFLDKVCIHQEDAELQRRAILKLGAFLKASDMMLICYSDLYLKKLWTVYEVASYLSLFGAKRMRFTHCSVTAGLTCIIFTWYLIDLVVLALLLVYDINWLEFALLPATFVCMACCLRAIHHSRASMNQHMVDFSVRACHCFREEDRAVVYGNIVALMEASHERALGESEALALFDEILRTELPPTMGAVFGHFGVPLHLALLLGALTFIPRVVDMLPHVWAGGGWREWYVLFLLFYIGCTFIVVPIIGMALMGIVGYRLRGDRAVSVLVVLVAALVGTAIAICYFAAALAVEAQAVTSDAWLVGYTLFVSVGSVLVPYSYARGGCQCRRRLTWAPPPPKLPRQDALGAAGAAEAAAAVLGAAREDSAPHLKACAEDVIFSTVEVSVLA